MKFPIEQPIADLNRLSAQHYAWLARMGYTRATPLEQLALIAGEIGEAVNTCHDGEPSAQLGEELADIVLRVMGLAQDQDIDLVEALNARIERNLAMQSPLDNRGRII